MKFNCPQCGSDNNIEIPCVFVKCEFCKNSLLLDVGSVSVVYTYKPLITVDQTGLFLKKDFDRVGFDEKINIVDTIPVYLPFWEIKGGNRLARGSSQFPDEESDLVSGSKIFFDSEDIINKNIEIVDIDTQPREAAEQVLHYLPFFKLIVNFRDKEYYFFVNAVNGRVSGNPIPYISTRHTFKLFLLFFTIFLLFLLNNLLVGPVLVAMTLNLLILAISYQVSLQMIEAKLYKK